MSYSMKHMTISAVRAIPSATCAAIACLLLSPLAIGASTAPAAATAKPDVASQRTFDTPEAAGHALIDAAEKFDTAALSDILGPDGKDLIFTGDTVQDKNQSAEFAEQGRLKSRVERDTPNGKKATLLVGTEDWPMPIPIVQAADGKWHFDTAAGRDEILYRRIGRNELEAIAACRNYVVAQNDYALRPEPDLKVNEYAQRIISTPGKKDGLVWRNPDGSLQGPLAAGLARMLAEGYTKRDEPIHGYYFKILKGQGPAAPLGQLDYVIKGVMIGGFALAAAPADYAVSGVKSFIVSQDGVVYERDLGPKTLETFKVMDRFNPDASWHPVLDQ